MLKQVYAFILVFFFVIFLLNDIIILGDFMKKVLLIDGNNILFRSYYATAYSGNIMKNSKGFPTNALYGLINMLNKIIKEENPEYVMIAFDKGKTFRHEKYADYKGGRGETPDELKMQFPVAKQLVTAMGFKYFEIDNYEADDIIGTFAKKATLDSDYSATIISSDKDLLQLINDDVEVKLLKTNDYIRMTKQEFINTYGIEPPRMVDLKALMGDSSDNIPGVAGVGEKTALKLLQEYGTLGNLYNNLDSVKGKLKEKLEASQEAAFMSYDLATIYKDVPIDTDFSKIKYTGIDALKYIEILNELEFYSLIKKMDIPEENIRENIVDIDYVIVNDMDNINIKDDFAIYLETFGYDYHNDEPLGLALYNHDCSYYIPFSVLQANPTILNSSYEKSTYDLKKLIYVLSRYGLKIANVSFDMMIAAYILNYNIKDDITYYMNNNDYQIDLYDQEFKVGSKLIKPDLEVIAKNACLKAKFIYEKKSDLIKELEQDNSYNLFSQLEMPLVEVLADMEITGIKVNRSYLDTMGVELKKKIEDISQSIYRMSGTEFNIASPKQLGDVLFIQMGLPYPKKVKDNNYSTGKEILDKIMDVHPIIPLIEEYRVLTKLYNNYIVGLTDQIAADGRIHTYFNQTLTRTGRLSSSNPNLQNIPIRNEDGKLIRKAFVPDADSLLLSSDYSQIELRVFAHMSNATNMIEAFKNNFDIHAKTASDIFGLPIDQIDSNMRRHAKAVNFGILYGISSFGLSEDLNIDVTSAKKFIDNYLTTFPNIKLYMDEVVANAHRDGYVKTIMNRKRIIDELNNKNYMIRQSGERMAKNTPIQGSAADILKKAMIEIYQEFNRRHLKSKMLIQVHDELVFNIVKEEEAEAEKIIVDIMENTYKLNVPLIVDVNKGNDWYEAK